MHPSSVVRYEFFGLCLWGSRLSTRSLPSKPCPCLSAPVCPYLRQAGLAGQRQVLARGKSLPAPSRSRLVKIDLLTHAALGFVEIEFWFKAFRGHLPAGRQVPAEMLNSELVGRDRCRQACQPYKAM